MKSLKYPHLFSPLQIGDTVLKNRIITAPMSVPSARTKVISSTDYGGMSVMDKSRGGSAVVTIGEHAIAKLADEPDPFEKYARDINKIDELESSNTPFIVKPKFEVNYLDELAKDIENNLARKVQIEQGKKSGSIKLEFYNEEDLERLAAALKQLKI